MNRSGSHALELDDILVAPETEPTDEELALVLREARELAVARRATADAWIAAKLKEAADLGRQNSRARRGPN
jgi:hypothetical protein